jgi:hypothetical protein
MEFPRPSTSTPKPQVVVRAEEEVDGGWLYDVEVTHAGQTTSHAITLGWRDHDLWCGGAIAPSRVLQSLVEYALSHAGLQLPAKFDAARIRRVLPAVDHELRHAI